MQPWQLSNPGNPQLKTWLSIIPTIYKHMTFTLINLHINDNKDDDEFVLKAVVMMITMMMNMRRKMINIPDASYHDCCSLT